MITFLISGDLRCPSFTSLPALLASLVADGAPGQLLSTVDGSLIGKWHKLANGDIRSIGPIDLTRVTNEIDLTALDGSAEWVYGSGLRVLDGHAVFAANSLGIPGAAMIRAQVKLEGLSGGVNSEVGIGVSHSASAKESAAGIIRDSSYWRRYFSSGTSVAPIRVYGGATGTPTAGQIVDCVWSVLADAFATTIAVRGQVIGAGVRRAAAATSVMTVANTCAGINGLLAVAYPRTSGSMQALFTSIEVMA